METKTKNLSAGLEDYIEAIYVSHINNEVLKGAELARKLNISRASVSEALSKLVNKGFIDYSGHEAIKLTELGLKQAQEVYNKHNILKNFFIDILEIPTEEAEENACKIEHIISKNILDKMSEYTKNHISLK